MSKRTITEWFNTLPEPYRSQALANHDMSYIDYPEDGRADSLDEAIFLGFDWSETTEGRRYWTKAWHSATNTEINEPKTALDKQEGGSHYQLPIQPIEYIVKNNIPYREGNVIKYVTRHRAKNGAEDIKKAIHYLQMILEDYNT